MGGDSGPLHLARALSELIALRGLANVQSGSQLDDAWRHAAGSEIAAATRVQGIRRGVMQVAVGNAPLLGELASFHKGTLLETFRKNNPHLKVRDLKFVLKGDMACGHSAAPRTAPPEHTNGSRRTRESA
jgi:hypothetical protein